MISLLDKFRMALAGQLTEDDPFWNEMSAAWWADWRRRGIREALVELVYGS